MTVLLRRSFNAMYSRILCIMMFVGGTKFRYFAVIGGAAAAAIGALVLFSSKFAYAMVI